MHHTHRTQIDFRDLFQILRYSQAWFMSKYGALTVYPTIHGSFLCILIILERREMRKFRNESTGYGFQIRHFSTLHEAAWFEEVREKAAESLGMLVRRQRTTWSTCCMYIRCISATVHVCFLCGGDFATTAEIILYWYIWFTYSQ